MNNYTRIIEPIVINSLKDVPAIFINGPRQAGKTTLTQQIARKLGNMNYLTFDDLTTLAAAKNDPAGFVANLQCPVVIDEIQLVPEIFRPLKKNIDQMRTISGKCNGQFLLTGSANILALPELSDPLVGRMQIITLYPFSINESLQTHSNFIDILFNNKMLSLNKKTNINIAIQDLITKATFPEISIAKEINKTNWFKGYLTTILQRDVKTLADIAKFSDLPLIVKIIASRAGRLLNDSSLARDANVNVMTLRRYRTLLEQIFLIHSLQPWYRNIGKRSVKSPKIYFNDTYFLCHILGIEPKNLQQNNPVLFDHILENFVATELLKQLTVFDNISLYHFRTHANEEVDFVLERQNGDLVGIEVKSKMSVTINDFNGLKALQKIANTNFIKGIILYLGNDIVPFGNDLFAVPLQALWG